MTEKIRPFSCGSQYMDWRYRNCDGCTKDVRERKDGKGYIVSCAIEAAISKACVFDGHIPKRIADRMGFTDPLKFGWDCPEKHPIPRKWGDK